MSRLGQMVEGYDSGLVPTLIRYANEPSAVCTRNPNRTSDNHTLDKGLDRCYSGTKR